MKILKLRNRETKEMLYINANMIIKFIEGIDSVGRYTAVYLLDTGIHYVSEGPQEIEEMINKLQTINQKEEI